MLLPYILSTSNTIISPDIWVHFILPLLVTLIGSSGFWAFLQYKDTKKQELLKEQKAAMESLQDALEKQKDVLIGLGHDKIMYLGGKYCERNYITHSEYENLYTYIYLPYKALGGNGSADKMMEQVNKLELRENVHFEKENRTHVHKTSK